MKTCACGAGNPDSAKFCGECGRSLQGTSPPAAGAAPPKLVFDPRMIVGPISSVEAARTMSWIGAAGAGVLFLDLLVLGSPVLATGQPRLIVLYLLKLGVFGGSAFALFRGWTVGGLASLVIHAWDLLAGLIAYRAAAETGMAQRPSVGWILLLALVWVVIPVALVCGIRGAMAWNRFRRGEIPPSTSL